MLFVGDVMMWDRTQKLLESEGVDYPFRATKTMIEGADLAIANLEGPIAVEAEMRTDGRFFYKVPPWTLAGLTGAGFDVVSLGNNHLGDCSEEGVLETMRHLDEAGLLHFGGGKNLDEALRPRVIKVGDTRVAFVGAVSGESFIPDAKRANEPGIYKRDRRFAIKRLGAKKDRPGAVVLSMEHLKEMVKRGREQADFVVVSLHFGIRYVREVSDHQREYGHAAIDAGADLVVGHHTHNWQAVEVYQGHPIVYGLGNFAFGSRNRNAKRGLMAFANLESGKLASMEFVLLNISNNSKAINYQSKPLTGEAAEKELALFIEASAAEGARMTIRDGRAVLEL